ncbi:MAG: hypothetical protein Q9220_002900 [cf. Caloplaca sp. 1 TL-2023]
MSSLSSTPTARLDPETITRVLFISPLVHIYTVPPLSSTKGYLSTSFSPLLLPPSSPPKSPPIETLTRLRVLETSAPSYSSNASSSNPHCDGGEDNQGTTITTFILLEDRDTGALFAEAPYTSPLTVQPVVDSSRFFALRVQDRANNRTAMLGIGFEERSEAFDFGVCLQGVRRVMGMEKDVSSSAAAQMKGLGARRGEEEGGKSKKNWGLKEGEMIRVEIGGGKGGRRTTTVEGKKEEAGDGDVGALFAIKPPPEGGGGMPSLAPPPSAKEIKAERRRSKGMVPPLPPEKGSPADLGFDDGEFGEFQ